MDWLEKIPEFLKMSWSELSKVMVGVFLTGFMAMGWIRSSRNGAKAAVRAAKMEAEAKVEAARSLNEQRLQEREREHAQQTAVLHQQISQLTMADHGVRVELESTRGELSSIKNRIKELESFDGKLWERELLAAPPAFIPPAQRRTRFIAVANLKGGVGKTTVAGNVGVMLAKRGKNVLMIDLDFQGSLTRLCIDRKELRRCVQTNETVRAMFDVDRSSVGDWLARIIRPVGGLPEGIGQCDVIPSFDDLADVELREEARWFIRRQPDSRFIFRDILHTSRICERYDYVIFDCPPRLTIGAVNAWACADWLLIPLVLDQQSVQATPRTLAWLQRLRHVSHAQLLGLVANQARYYGGNLVQSYQTALNQLPTFLQNNGFALNGAFCEPIRMDNATISSAVEKGRIPAAATDAESLFKSLADKIERATAR